MREEKWRKGASFAAPPSKEMQKLQTAASHFFSFLSQQKNLLFRCISLFRVTSRFFLKKVPVCTPHFSPSILLFLHSFLNLGESGHARRLLRCLLLLSTSPEPPRSFFTAAEAIFLTPPFPLFSKIALNFFSPRKCTNNKCQPFFGEL